MDLAAFVARAQALREFEVTAQGITLRLRQPGAFDLRRVVERVGSARPAACQLPLITDALVGWSGVEAAKVGPVADGDPAELPFDVRLVPLVAEAYPAAFDAAFAQIMERAEGNRKAATAAEAELKN